MEPQDHSPEQSRSHSLEELAGELGFVETAELQDLRRLVGELSAEPDAERISQLISQYRQTARDIEEGLNPPSDDRYRLGQLIAVATLRRDAGRLDHYLEDLADAAEYAFQMGYDDVVAELEAAIDRAL